MRIFYRWGMQTRWFMIDWTKDRPKGWMILQRDRPFSVAWGPIYLRIGAYR